MTPLNSISLLEHAVREDLNKVATRVMAVINPVKVIITNNTRVIPPGHKTFFNELKQLTLAHYCICEVQSVKLYLSRAIALIGKFLTNYPEGQEEILEMENNPEDPAAGTHKMTFSREIYIERDEHLTEVFVFLFRGILHREQTVI